MTDKPKPEVCGELHDPISCADGEKIYFKCQLPKGHEGIHDAYVKTTLKERVSDFISSIWRGDCF